MRLSEIKEEINNKKMPKLPIVFIYGDSDFIPYQYIDGVKNISNSQIISVSSLSEVGSNNPFLDDNIIYVYKCDTLTEITNNLSNLIIVAKKIGKKVSDYYENYIVEVPPLEEWQIRSFIRTKCGGLNENQIAWIIKTYSTDLYKLQSEIDKVAVFPKETQEVMFDEFYDNKVFDINREEVTFQVAKAIQENNKYTLLRLLQSISQSELENVSLIALLQSNLKRTMRVWLNKDPTEQNTGLNTKQIWAINKLPRIYDRNELIKLFDLLSGIDRRIVNGEFPEEYTLDYLLMKLMR